MKELDILNSQNLAVVGVSRNKSKFGRMIFDELKKRGRNVIGINKNLVLDKNTGLYPDITSVEGPIDAAIFVTNPKETLNTLKIAFAMGIKNFWFQQGSESKEIIEFCERNELNYVKGKCVFMYLEPVQGFHKFHKFINKFFGKY